MCYNCCDCDEYYTEYYSGYDELGNIFSDFLKSIEEYFDKKNGMPQELWNIYCESKSGLEQPNLIKIERK